MQTSEEARYRMRLAAENAAKAVLALAAPVGATHEPAVLLRRVLSSGAYPSSVQPRVERLAKCAAKLGWSVHVETDYGDYSTMRTPWQLFDEADARQALALAEEATQLASELVGGS